MQSSVDARRRSSRVPLAPVRGAGSPPRTPTRPADPKRAAPEGLGRAARTRRGARRLARRRGHTRVFRGTPRRAGPAPGSVPTPGAPAPVLNRGVPRTGRRRRAPLDRGARLEGLRQPSAPHRSSRAAPRSRLRSATRRLAPRRPARPLSSNQSPGTPRARSVFGLSARGRPFRAQFFAAARREGPVGVQRRALRLSGPPAAALGGQNLVRLH